MSLFTPPGIMKSLTHGLIQTYQRHNTQKEMFNKNLWQLFQRLIARGHLHEDIHPIFLQAAETIDNKKNNDKLNLKYGSNTSTRSPQLLHTRKKEQNSIFFHLPYHHRDISQKQIHHIYQKTCNAVDNLQENFQKMDNDMGGTMKITKLTIAYLRGQNLHDILCSSILHEHDNCKVSKFLSN